MDFTIPLESYKPHILAELKNLIFRHYPYIEKTRILNGDFDESLIEELKSYNKNAGSDWIKIKSLISDYAFLTPGTKTNRLGGFYNSQSEVLKFIEMQYDVMEEMCRHAVDNSLTDIQNEVYELLMKSENSYIVGGWVRDVITGHEPKDMDFVTDIPYNELEQMFIENGFEVKAAGKEFMVLHISKCDEKFEIANFRNDGTYTNGKPDKVEPGTIYDDGQRRDFTVNALYYSCAGYQLMDPTGLGVLDVYHSKLKFIGKPEDRIQEDYIRVIRFYRFLGKGFIPDPVSLTACRRNFNTAYEKMAPERLRLELEKMAGIIYG